MVSEQEKTIDTHFPFLDAEDVKETGGVTTSARLNNGAWHGQ